jgi:hypothetical protein
VELLTLPDNVCAKTSPQVQLGINNSRYKALLDTGAMRNFISRKFAQFLKVKIHSDNNVQVTTGTNAIVRTVGSCIIRFTLANTAFEEEFTVLEDSPFKLIMGTNFIVKSRIVIDLHNAKYWFTAADGSTKQHGRILNAEFLCALQGLTELQDKDLNSLLGKFPEVFSETLGCTDLVTCKFKVPGDPISQKPYPTTPKKREIMKQHIDEMLKLGIIVPSQSEWTSPVTMVTRDKIDYRFTIDYRKINLRIRSDPYPMPRMDALLHNLGQASFLTVLDLKKGYWQIAVDPQCMDYLAFSCEYGKFAPVKMPFGIKLGPSIFQRLVNKILGHARGIFADAYLDDIIIYSRTWEEHLEHVGYVLEQLRKANLTLNSKKCSFGKTTLKYLGFIVGPNGIEMDKEKISALTEYPRPRNVKEVRRFLGLCGWYRHFIDHFADVALPLNKLLRNATSFKWSEEQVAAFEKLKSLIANATTLAYPDFSKRFVVRTDASDEGLSAVLSQDYNGVDRPISFASRTLSAQEKHYFAQEKECCAILFGLKRFEPYIDGQEFDLQTDNQALIWLNSMRDVNSKFMRWSLRIQDFQPVITHIAGTKNVVADALSRAVVGKSEDVDENREIMYPPINRSNISLLITLTNNITLDTLRDEQKKDRESQALLTDLGDEFTAENGIIYKIGRYGGRIPFIPINIRGQVLAYFHDRPESGHMGFRKTLGRLVRRVFWFGMQEDIYKYISSCPLCQACKNPNVKPAGVMKSVQTRGPWDMLAVDLMGPLPTTPRGNTQLLVVVDHFSKWVELFPIRKATAFAVAQKLENEVFCRWGAPSSLLSDNGKQFVASLTRKMCKNWGVRQKFTSFYHPQCNITERVNKNIVAIIRTYVDRKHAKWDEFLPQVGMALRTAVSDTTGYSPAMLNFGREMKTLFDRRLEPDSEEEFESRIEYKNALIDKLEAVYVCARQNMEKAQAQQSKYYNLKHRKVTYKEGDLVCLRTHIQSDKLGKVMKKLAYKWEGPFVISKVCSPLTYSLIRKDTNEDVGTHSVKNLKKFYERPEKFQDTAVGRRDDADSESEKSDVEVNSTAQNGVKSKYSLRSRKLGI